MFYSIMSLVRIKSGIVEPIYTRNILNFILMLIVKKIKHQVIWTFLGISYIGIPYQTKMEWETERHLLKAAL